MASVRKTKPDERLVYMNHQSESMEQVTVRMESPDRREDSGQRLEKEPQHDRSWNRRS